MRLIRFTVGCDMVYEPGSVHAFDEGVADCYVNVRRAAEYIDVPVPRDILGESALAFLANAPHPSPLGGSRQFPSLLPEGESEEAEPADVPDPIERFTANQVVDVPQPSHPPKNRRTGRPRQIARTGAAPARPHA